jgi:hypothetical protein
MESNEAGDVNCKQNIENCKLFAFCNKGIYNLERIAMRYQAFEPES